MYVQLPEASYLYVIKFSLEMTTTTINFPFFFLQPFCPFSLYLQKLFGSRFTLSTAIFA